MDTAITNSLDLGEYLLRVGKLTPANLERARRAAEEGSVRLSMALINLGLVSEGAVAEAFADMYGLTLAAPGDWPEEPIRRLNPRWLHQARALPLKLEEGRVTVAMADPEDGYVRQALRLAFGGTVEVRVAPPGDIERAIERLHGRGDGTPSTLADGADEDVQRLRDLASEAPVVRFVNHMIAAAVEEGASDVHLEPYEASSLLRFRIDGDLHDREPPPKALLPAIVSRLKIMARLDIAERRLPQDGRIKVAMRGREVDLRISSAPTLFGESVVLRILDRGSVELDFQRLGFAGRSLAAWRRAIGRPNGIVLVTGPTGSGKTTTLYASLAEINRPDRKIFTVEDPVEYQLARINQVPVRPQIGLTFAHVLRSLLRQDPDIIMVGEIRDRETAQIAVEASLTGHLVLSTLHTNDAPGAITRLLDMGIEDFMLASTLNAVLAQRLVRTLCPVCRLPLEGGDHILDHLDPDRHLCDQPKLMRPVGCPECRGTGWKGRTTIAELLEVNDRVRQAIVDHADARTIARIAGEEGMESLRRAGLRKAFAGITTVEEIFRVTSEG